MIETHFIQQKRKKKKQVIFIFKMKKSVFHMCLKQLFWFFYSHQIREQQNKTKRNRQKRRRNASKNVKWRQELNNKCRLFFSKEKTPNKTRGKEKMFKIKQK